jgi:tRNA wybutosine-synthesizing protein 2
VTGELAVVVERERAENAIDSLASEGVYDDTRSVEAYGEGVAVPVTAAPTETPVIEVVETELPARNRGLRELLADRGWSDAELDRLPASWAVIGDCVLVQATDDADGTPFPRPTEVGDALLELHGGADTVLLARGVSGPRREPDVEVVAGIGDTEVVHTEHGTRYALDLAETMFSPGNQAERVRMGEVVAGGERVFDMFAGVGYFTLPMARAGAAVTAAEINPEAYRYLVENAVLNGVESRVSAFRADCRDVDVAAERVVMGHYEATDYLDAALAALDPGGVVHVHDAVPEAELWDRPVGAIEAAAADYDRTVDVLDRRIVKSHAPGVDHVVVDARVD